jgi:hypothetical protein
MLYNLFKDTIAMSASLSMIADLINQELGQKDVIQAADIKYCRHYFRDKGSKSDVVKEVSRPLAMQPPADPDLPTSIPTVSGQEATWTNPDKNKTSTNSKTTSKFSKNERA